MDGGRGVCSLYISAVCCLLHALPINAFMRHRVKLSNRVCGSAFRSLKGGGSCTNLGWRITVRVKVSNACWPTVRQNRFSLMVCPEHMRWTSSPGSDPPHFSGGSTLTPNICCPLPGCLTQNGGTRLTSASLLDADISQSQSISRPNLTMTRKNRADPNIHGENVPGLGSADDLWILLRKAWVVNEGVFLRELCGTALLVTVRACGSAGPCDCSSVV